MPDISPTISARTILNKAIITVALFFVFWTANVYLGALSTLQVGAAAGLQLENSDYGAISASYNAYAWSCLAISSVILIVALLIVWWGTAKNLLSIAIKAMASLAVLVIAQAQDAHAYYQQQDWPEVYYIGANETCMFVPDTGANQDTQVKFGSEQYLEKAKVAAKRFQIPHAKLPASSYWKDYYVPAGRLICVDRKPYARRWTSNSTTGSSSRNEALECQSSGGHTAKVDMSIAAVVTEDLAHRYLYWFGTRPIQGNREDPNVAFASTFYALDMNDVMDNFVSGKVVSTVCREFSQYTIDEINAKSSELQAKAEIEIRKFLESRGISLIYAGWGNITFDTDVQKAINDRWSADKIAPSLEVRKQLADVAVKEGLARSLSERGIPMPQNWAIIPQGIVTEAAKLFAPQAK